MLTESQIKYLASIPDNQKVIVRPWNSKGLEIANKIIDRIHEVVPSLEVILLGSLPLKIAGQEDIDISVFCLKSEQLNYMEKLKTVFGEPNAIGKNSIRWNFNEEVFDVSVYLTDPTAETTQAQIAVFNLLKNNPDLLKEYEEIKLGAKDLTYKEYQRRKYEFYNRILK